ncbi:MAG: hypothetical protein IJD02_02830 [Lachnospiraceae bacterium]|nr:hypothetical protein [Lachnospiraceae bacterium]
MRKLVKYDLRNGWHNTYYKIGIFVLVIVVINIIGVNSIKMVIDNNKINADILDYICFVLGGPRYIPEGMFSMYVIPVLWLLIQVGISYTIGYYAMNDLHAYGQQVLLRSSSRAKWWISKIVWNVTMVSLLYVIIFIVTIVSAQIAGCKWDWELTTDIARDVCNIDMIAGKSQEILIVLMVMPLLTSITLSLIQMVLALILSPMIGFIVVQSIVILSTIYAKKWLISNYAMLSHNKITCASDIKYTDGIVINVILCLAAFVIGLCYFQRCDILPKNEEV